MRVAFVADSTLGLAPARARELGIHVVPARVRIGEADLADYLEATPEAVARAFAEGLPIATSAPPPGAFAEAFRRLLEAHDRVVAVTVSRRLSGTFDSARLAARDFGGRVLVLDSMALNAGLRFLIEAARRWLAEGEAFEGIPARAEAYARRIVGWILPASLEGLFRSGRIGNLTHVLGRVLRVLPVLELKEGRLEAAGRVRGFSRGVRELARRYRPLAPRRVALAHAENPRAVAELQAAVEALGGRVDPIVHDAGAAVAAHGGPGSVGLIVDPGDA